MGVSHTNLMEDVEDGAEGSGNGLGLGDMPESCIACVLKHLIPPEICNLARVKRTFLGAASSDAVWVSKLPPHYEDLIHFLPPDRCRGLSKKDLFVLFTRPIAFNDNTMEAWLDKVTCGVCIAISAKALFITKIDDRRHWEWRPTEESRFHVVAFLKQIQHFEVDGLLKFRFPAGVYSLSFRLQLGGYGEKLGLGVSNFVGTHGWDINPVQFELSTSDGQQVSCNHYLEEPDDDDANSSNMCGSWIDYKVGEFTVDDSDRFMEIKFSMKQIDTHSKRGICVDTVSIIPSE